MPASQVVSKPGSWLMASVTEGALLNRLTKDNEGMWTDSFTKVTSSGCFQVVLGFGCPFLAALRAALHHFGKD